MNRPMEQAPKQNSETDNSSLEPSNKKQWETPSCEDLDDLKIEGGAGLIPESSAGALS